MSPCLSNANGLAQQEHHLAVNHILVTCQLSKLAYLYGLCHDKPDSKVQPVGNLHSKNATYLCKWCAVINQ